MSLQNSSNALEAVLQTISEDFQRHVRSRIVKYLDGDLGADLANGLNQSVRNALLQQNARVSQDCEENVREKLAALQTKYDLLNARHEALRYEHATQRRSLEALAPVFQLEDSLPMNSQVTSDSKKVARQIYEAVVQQNHVLRQQLQECMEQCKGEAMAKTLLMTKIRGMKEVARQWEEFSKDWHKWRVKRLDRGTPDQAGTPINQLEQQFNKLPPVEDLNMALQRDGERLGVAKLLQHKAKTTTQAQPTIVHGQASPFTEARSDIIGEQLLIKTSTPGYKAVRPTGPDRSEVQKMSKLSAPDSVAAIDRVRSSAPPTDEPFRSRKPFSAHINTSSPEIEFVSERILKRKHGRAPPRSSDSHLYIKREPSSASDQEVNLAQYRPESMDLDDVGGIVDTPRKRRRLRMLQKSSRAFARQPLRTERSMSEPPMATQLLDCFSASKVDSIKPLATSSVGPTRTPLSTINGNTRAVLPVSDKKTDCNERDHQTGRNSKTILSRKEKQFLHIANDVNPDDEDENDDGADSVVSTSRTMRRDTARLAAMLKMPVPPAERSAKRPSRAPPKSTPLRADNVASKRLPASTTSKSTPVTKRTKLRDKQFEQLNLGDFKHNPRFNHGYNADKSKSGRQCRPGCTDARCCGEAMRAIAKSMPFLKITRPPIPSSAEDQRLSDDEYLIKWHMGHLWSRDFVSTKLPRDEYEELLLTARTALLAERYGRHKEEHEKRMTPPGYWQMSMPCTQELSVQHSEAAEIEAGLIRDRWSEAMKGNGRWVFIDE